MARDPQYTILREAERKIEREICEIEKNPSVNSYRAASLAKDAFELGIETGKKMAEAKQQLQEYASR